jgi:hypothetical protein
MTNPEAPSTAPVAWCQSDDFRNALSKRQSFSGWREPHPDCDMALYAHPQASATAPATDQAEGPSLADVAELCAELGFHLPDNDTYDGVSLGTLHDMITAAITRWRAPVAQPVATPAPQKPDADRVLKLAAIIREVDLKPDANTFVLGENELAEAILAHPGFGGCHDGPAALPAQGEVAELVKWLQSLEDASIWFESGSTVDLYRARVAALLKEIPALSAPGFQVGPQECIPHD